ncbi:class I SAM-dependent methyltransferase [Alphaproteobacteria bacterium]|nr:class I SAM-dependent methyltransferase [Alphaproteobacteria bacterium]
MTKYVNHDLKLENSNSELARQTFMLSMRSYVMLNMASGMKQLYENKVEPNFKKNNKRKPRNGDEIHKTIKNETFFKFYSSIRCNTQEMSFRSVLPPIEKSLESLTIKAKKLSKSKKVKGSLKIKNNFEIPKNVSSLDVHLMPGCYHTEYSKDDISQGAIYDNGVSVFSMGLFGKDLDDIGQSISLFVKSKYPKFKPNKILDLGCTIGHNTLPWGSTYPNSEIHAVDVGAPVLRYGNARAQSKGIPVNFHQQNAENLSFESSSFDLVFSSMFLHEVPKKGITNILKEAYRVLKPGGMMIHMELPPNGMLEPYDSFYLDWDSYYNKEPYYKIFRDLKPLDICKNAGFKNKNFFNFIIPSLGQYGAKVIKDSAKINITKADDQTGRFTKGIHWYCFGAWK